jgi:hypothetical protein
VRSALLCLLLGAAAAAAAQTVTVPEAAPPGLPHWVVPVLRLVSETHVEPTTGVVLASSGLVLVPDDFAGMGDEIVVLDGGNDIVRNGRPAHLQRAFPELGLEVLMVEGLSRTPAPLAATGPADGDTVRLRAFPPAEEIAEGAAPVEASATIVLLTESDTPSIAAATPLPNVTGPLLDACGNLVGLSLTGSVQTMTPSSETRYRWQGALREVLETLGLPVGGVPCTPPAVAETTPAEIPPPVPPEPDIETAEAPMPEPAPGEPEPEVSSKVPVEEEVAGSEIPLDELPPWEDHSAGPQDGPAESAGEESQASSWWWLAGGLLLLAGGVAVHRLRRAGPVDAAAPATTSGDGEVEGTASNLADPTQPEAAGEPTADSQVVLRGHYADGRSLEISARVSADAINLDIGRGGADLEIDSLAVSRRHARLNGTRAALTITDLGSSNGTSIDGVPCLEDEILYLEPGSTVILGDVRFSVSVEPESDRP